MLDDMQEPSNLADAESQYSLTKIMAIWAVVSLPMLILVFFVAPFLAPYTDVHPFLLIWYLGIAGMAWQFVVSMWILHQELELFTWSAIKDRIWLNKPSDTNTGKHRALQRQTIAHTYRTVLPLTLTTLLRRLCSSV